MRSIRSAGWTGLGCYRPVRTAGEARAVVRLFGRVRNPTLRQLAQVFGCASLREAAGVAEHHYVVDVGFRAVVARTQDSLTSVAWTRSQRSSARQSAGKRSRSSWAALRQRNRGTRLHPDASLLNQVVDRPAATGCLRLKWTAPSARTASGHRSARPAESRTTSFGAGERTTRSASVEPSM